ncbi:MAG: peroxidase [Clostridia bacterium]|nr:peroxidase [Clostridia bacterium]
MAWIRIIHEKMASGKLKTLYHRITGGEDRAVANILKVHSVHPETLDAHLRLYKTIMFGESGLSRAQRESIATIVSKINLCDY